MKIGFELEPGCNQLVIDGATILSINQDRKGLAAPHPHESLDSGCEMVVTMLFVCLPHG